MINKTKFSFKKLKPRKSSDNELPMLGLKFKKTDKYQYCGGLDDDEPDWYK